MVNRIVKRTEEAFNTGGITAANDMYCLYFKNYRYRTKYKSQVDAKLTEDEYSNCIMTEETINSHENK